MFKQNFQATPSPLLSIQPTAAKRLNVTFRLRKLLPEFLARIFCHDMKTFLGWFQAILLNHCRISKDPIQELLDRSEEWRGCWWIHSTWKWMLGRLLLHWKGSIFRGFVSFREGNYLQTVVWSNLPEKQNQSLASFFEEIFYTKYCCEVQPNLPTGILILEYAHPNCNFSIPSMSRIISPKIKVVFLSDAPKKQH